MNNKRKIGDKVGTWTIIEKKIKNEPTVFYICECDCGRKSEVRTNRMSSLTKCLECAGRTASYKLVGTSHGRLTCLSRKKDGMLEVKCECGHTYGMEVKQFRETNSCRWCRAGYYPGKKEGNSVLITRIPGSGKWKKRCVCGVIFEGDHRKSDCGCIAKSKRFEDAKKKIGLSKDMLTIKKIAKEARGRVVFVLECVCGNKIERVNGHEFKSKSCGCLVGVKRGEENSTAKLSNNDVLSVRELFASKLYTVQEISKMINMPVRNVNRILSEETWSNI